MKYQVWWKIIFAAAWTEYSEPNLTFDAALDVMAKARSFTFQHGQSSFVVLPAGETPFLSITLS